MYQSTFLNTTSASGAFEKLKKLTVPSIKRLFLLGIFLFPGLIIACGGSGCGAVDQCCGGMGGIQYCDGSAGRFICHNGRYSSCYCKRSAVMDIQGLKGCCMWQGGVLKFDHRLGLMICNNGGVSEICSIGHVEEKVAAW